jgi:hypothetical protein
MAHVVLLKTGNRREFFVTDQAVGAGLPNVPQDVLLVQFFLRVASETARGFAGFQPPGELPIAIDGRCGQQTQTYISFYQKEVNRRVGRKLLEQDGRIDPIRPGQSFGLSQTFFTILDLNVAYRARRGDNTRIETDPLFPQALGPSLFL